MTRTLSLVIDVCCAWLTVNGQIRMRFDGCDACALLELQRAGENGGAPTDNSAPCWASYIHKLRCMGFAIETVHEQHSGPFAGTHAHYGLRSDARLTTHQLS